MGWLFSSVLVQDFFRLVGFALFQIIIWSEPTCCANKDYFWIKKEFGSDPLNGRIKSATKAEIMKPSWKDQKLEMLMRGRRNM